MNFTYENRTALFWDVTQREVVILTDVSGQHVGPILRLSNPSWILDS
jgi:hypothetical protein